jgi:phosphoglycerate dehydrogenase-like enzyme
MVSLPELLEQSDFISLHAPLVPETRHLMNSDRLKRMKPTAYLINSARAQVVNEPALVQALREGWIAGAALDVLPVEPPPPDHPLLHMENVILAPHLGSFTREGMLRMLQAAADQVLMVLQGERPPNLVNPDVWEKRRM